MTEQAPIIDVLSVQNMSVTTTARTVVDDVSIQLSAGSIAALLGPNGAGKSELVLGISGALQSTGQISIGSQSLTGAGLQATRAAGVAAVPEGHQVLARMTVQDNLRVAGPMLEITELNRQVENAYVIFPELVKLSDKLAGSLSGGQQQMLAIAQALISKPKFLLIDEMSLGLAPVVIDRLVAIVQELREHGVGILLIEQFTQLALSLADHCYIMAQGKIQYSGPAETLVKNKSILENAYLGVTS